MAARIKGITIEINGDSTKLTKALADVDHALHTTQSNLRDLNRALKLDPGNAALLKDKQVELANAIDATKEKLEKEKEALEQMKNTQGFDANSEAARNLQTQIDLDTVALQEAQTEMKNFGSVGQQQMKLVASKMKELGGKISQVGKSLTTAVTLPVLGAGTAAVKMASDYEENLNKVDVAFQDSSDSVKEWAKTATTQFGLSESAALEATSLFGDMGTSMGLTTKDAADMSMSLAGLAGDLSSFKNVGIDEAMTALKGVFTGETESLKNLGVVMTETNLEEFAETIGKSYKEMSQAEKVTLRYQYVLKNTQNAQGDYARTSDGTANSIRTLQASVNNLAVAFGQELIPVITPVINKITDIVQKFGELDEGTKKMILVIAGIAAAVGPVLVVVGTVISSIGPIVNAIGSVTSALGSAMSAITALGGPITLIIAAVGALVAAFIYFYNTNDEFRERVNAVIENIKEAFGAFVEKAKEWLQQAAEWLAPIVESVKNYLGAIVDFVKAVIDKIKEYLSAHEKEINAIISTIKTIVTVGFEFMKAKIQITMELIKGIITTVLNVLANLFKATTALIKGDWSGALEYLKSAAKAGIDGVLNVFENLKNILNNTFNNIMDSMANWGRDMIDNLIDGIRSKFSSVYDTVSDIAGIIADFLHFTEPDVGPLKNFHTFMPDMMKEMVKGIDAGLPMLENAADKIASTLVPTTMTNGISGANTTNNNSVNITVYGAPGQDAKAIGDYVLQRANAEIYSKGAVFA